MNVVAPKGQELNHQPPDFQPDAYLTTLSWVKFQNCSNPELTKFKS